jgi:hypothetical protein
MRELCTSPPAPAAAAASEASFLLLPWAE